ncbi:putative Uncharacterized hydrolase C22A12.06c [Glarea lozoyensis 74030]|uniref:Putative Uncharacterized hydrolase C22A12.06c n=1 Tax=Glarea lozoyensis (strain ATCC 74030 / MF5533) TaxID=1104152 RepID=H0EQ35_GLAL7|nr:putative Uncharacterized hydrolase C22A12.06c [Glarea lozoyensis 74030]
MKFLCLHGYGTNNKVFEMQTAALRYELGTHHTFEFVEGTVPAPMDPELQSLFSPSEQAFSYFDTFSTQSCQTALQNLTTYIQVEGPFDAILAFSAGATLAATYLAQSPNHPFKCAIFLSGVSPIDPIVLKTGVFRSLDPETDGEMIVIPTAHVYGKRDTKFPGSSAILEKLCVGEKKAVLVHEGGHPIPGSANIPTT